MIDRTSGTLNNAIKAALFTLTLSGASAALAQEFELSFGADVVTNYISKGFTQTDDDPALQGWAEAAYGKVYLSFFTSNVSFGGVNDLEYDLGLGLRHTIGAVDLDFGYVQYFYRDDKTDYGEAYLTATFNISPSSFIGFEYYREVYFDYDTVYVSGGTADVGWGLSLSGGVGSDFGTRGLSQDAVYADIGLSKEISDHAAFDLRAHYSAIESNRLIATLSFYN